MTTPTEIADLVRATAPAEEIDERPGVLFARAPLADPALRGRWLSLRAALPEYLSNVSIVEADSDTVLGDDEAPPENRLYRITLESRHMAGQLRLFFAESLAHAEAAFGNAEHVLLATMHPQETFSTFRNRVQLWTRDAPEPFAPSEPLPDPRTYSSDFTGSAEVPADIRPWLIRAAPHDPGPGYAAWCRVAARRLLAAIADRVAAKDGAITYHFNGPPACVVSLTDNEACALLPRLQEGGLWVYPDVRDADTRHLLLASEWARTNRQGDVSQLGDRSLESAQNAYAAYVKSGSKETLKAISELRKAVVDEGQKAAQRAQDLAGSMWKDVAVAAAPFVLKILPDASRASSRTLTGVIALCAASFLVFSFCIQVFINKRYFRSQKAARAVWQRALNVTLTPKDVEEYSEAPIKAGVADYRTARLAIGCVYFLLIAALLVFAVENLIPEPTLPNPAPDGGANRTATPSSVPAANQSTPPTKPPEVRAAPSDARPNTSTRASSPSSAKIQDAKLKLGHARHDP